MNHHLFLQSCQSHEAALSTCTPRDVKSAVIHFNVSEFSSKLFHEYGVVLPKSIEKSVIKRQAEYLAGRILAQRILIGSGHFDNELKIGSAREPLWPKGFIGSISHSDNIALVIAAKANQYNLIGCDVEPLLSLELIEEIKLTVLLSEELPFLNAKNSCKQEVFTLIYSAKESLYKALYPKVGYFFDFYAAKVVKINRQENIISLSLTNHLNDTYRKHHVFTLKFAHVKNNIMTVLYIE